MIKHSEKFSKSHTLYLIFFHTKRFSLPKGKIHTKMYVCVCLLGGGLLCLYADWILIMQYIAFINFFAINGTFKVEDKVDLSQ